MLIYILHKDKIYDFSLPAQVEGKLIITDYDDFNSKRNLVNVEAKNNKWFIYENNNVKISYNGKKVEAISLEPYSTYSLNILGIETVLLCFT